MFQWATPRFAARNPSLRRTPVQILATMVEVTTLAVEDSRIMVIVAMMTSLLHLLESMDGPKL